jgi:hypothetical protein
MAHFAKLDDNNIVTEVIVVNNSELLDEAGQESEAKGIVFCQSLFGGNWKQTSYNATFRKNYAGIGYHWDGTGFYAPQPYLSWTLDDKYQWQPPVAKPIDDKFYTWSEDTLNWVEVDLGS